MKDKTTKSNWPLPSAKPEEVGFSSQRLARIVPGMQKFIDQEMVPNVITLIARHGKVVHQSAQGYMDLDTRKAAKIDTICRLWSNTKPITGVATMICVENGLLDLDDPVSKYIPAFKNQVVRAGPDKANATVPAVRDITVRDCLRNTTGLTNQRRAPVSYLTEFGQTATRSGLLDDPEKVTGNIHEKVEALARLPLEAQPGTQYEYQVGFPVLSVVLETVTGKNLEEYYQENIFHPLGMKDTSFYLPASKFERFPTLYRPIKESGIWKLGIVEKPENSEKVTGPGNYFESGGGNGGVLSTAADYSRFAQMLLNGGELEGTRILGRKMIEIMTSSHTGDLVLSSPGPGFAFGLGLGVFKGCDIPALRSIGTYGWSGAAGTTFFVDPKEDLIAICFSQIFTYKDRPDNTFHKDFERMVYQALT
jgi:CubicO group peptidase (beta-lactamase class C family)